MKLEIDEKKLEQIMKDFHVLTGFRIVLFDNQYNEIISYPKHHCLFCQNMKTSPDTNLLCQKSDETSFAKCKEKNKLIIYHCHAGLIEATAPLIDQDTVIGYMMFGQITDNPSNIFTPDIPLKTNEQIESAAKIMEACTFYLIYQNAVSARKDNFITNMDNFLINHISDDLSVEAITKELGISKTKLYDTCNLYYGHSIAKHIKLLRIETAKKLLTTTNLSVSYIAGEVGFEDYNYFCRIFKKETGISAKKYRMQKSASFH